MPRIKVIEPKDAAGDLRQVYDDVAARRGAIANVLQIQSLQPATLRTHLDMYLSILYGKSTLTRQERETIAVAVSEENGCRYCVNHHADALSRYQKDAAVLSGLAQGETPGTLTVRETALVWFARNMTKAPSTMGDQDIEELRAVGLQDEEILMATLTAAYFNFVNRVVHTLGVELEPTQAGYKY